jgi:hypothetical protein
MRWASSLTPTSASVRLNIAQLLKGGQSGPVPLQKDSEEKG